MMGYIKRLFKIDRYFILSYVRVCVDSTNEFDSTGIMCRKGEFPSLASLQVIFHKTSTKIGVSGTHKYTLLNINEVSKRDYTQYLSASKRLTSKF